MFDPSSKHIASWLLLGQLSILPPQEWLSVCEQHGFSVEQFVELSNSDWKQIGISESAITKRDNLQKQVERAMSVLEKDSRLQCISYDHCLYPDKLKLLSHPPAALFVLGDTKKLTETQIAIVGSRHATANGANITQSIASQLTDNDFIVTSGLARGIDSSAHRGAMTKGHTIAVLGCGVDVCYPKYNQSLYQKILDCDGAIVSEFLPGTPPRPYHFPQRNRIVAALSDGVLVVEAKIRSGSLITANLAADLGKEVFAVPGNINHPLSEGVNWLIQQGAKLVTSYKDILEEFGILPEMTKTSTDTKKPLARDPILDSVDYDVTSLTSITKRSKLSSQAVLTALLEYELRGLVAAVPGGYLKLRGK
jgi:DNA processing protein